MGYCLSFEFIYRAFVMLLSKQSQGYKASVILFFFYIVERLNSLIIYKCDRRYTVSLRIYVTWKKGVVDFLVFGLPGWA